MIEAHRAGEEAMRERAALVAQEFATMALEEGCPAAAGHAVAVAGDIRALPLSDPAPATGERCCPAFGSCTLESGHAGQHSQDGPYAGQPAPKVEPFT